MVPLLFKFGNSYEYPMSWTDNWTSGPETSLEIWYLTICQPVKEFQSLYGSRTFIIVFTKSVIGQYPEPVRSNSHAYRLFLEHLFWCYTHLHVYLPRGPWAFSTKLMYAFLIYPTRATPPAYLAIYDVMFRPPEMFPCCDPLSVPTVTKWF